MQRLAPGICSICGKETARCSNVPSCICKIMGDATLQSPAQPWLRLVLVPRRNFGAVAATRRQWEGSDAVAGQACSRVRRCQARQRLHNLRRSQAHPDLPPRAPLHVSLNTLSRTLQSAQAEEIRVHECNTCAAHSGAQIVSRV